VPRLAYASRSWLHDATLTAKSDIVDGHTHTHEERRASARRGNGVEPWMVNRNSPTGSRTQQEWRASARRANETHLQWRAFFPERVRSRSTGGLRPPLLVVLQSGHLSAKLQLVRCTNARFRRAAGVSPPWERNASAMARVFPGASMFAQHGGLRPPLLAVLQGGHLPTKLRLVRCTNARFRRAAGVSPPWCNVPTMCRENRTLSGDWRGELQERRVSGRRGVIA
jgi:hypothetical protein